MNITFLGAAGEVTGSSFLVETELVRFLVYCGMFQGLGAAQSVRIMGEEIPVRAHRYTIGGLSAHADRAALLGWLSHFKTPPRQTFVVHGEAETAQLFARLIHKQLDWAVQTPEAGKVYQLA